MVQLPEPADVAGFRTIAEIGQERLRRVIAVLQNRGQHLLDEPDNMEDLGFKVYRLERSNFRVWHDYTGESRAEVQSLFDQFETEIRNALAEHIVEHIEFVIEDGVLEHAALDELFPPTKSFPQKELIAGSAQGLYDQVQVDSDVERYFVADRLNGDDKVICYFKFPPAFKVTFPKIIGNYNPDWGILRRGENGQVILRLIRETKGAEDPRKLQFAHEKRKITVAREHFRVLGVDYRVVTHETPDWWRPEDLGR